MSPRRNQKKSTKAKGTKNEGCNEVDNISKQMDVTNNVEDNDVNAKCCKLWLSLCEENRKEREHYITINVLSTFLYGIVPPGFQDKLIDWCHECCLLEDKDIQQVFAVTDKRFVSIKLLENTFNVLSNYWVSKKTINNILQLKDRFIEKVSVKSAIECANTTDWFRRLRTKLSPVPIPKEDVGDMSLLLVIYFFAEHVQSLICKETDVFQKYEEECCMTSENVTYKTTQWAELKNEGNKEFDKENYRSAITCYSRAAVYSPFNYIVYGNRSMSYLRLKNYRQALLDAKRSIVLKPNWDKGWYRFDQAVKALRQNEGTNKYLSYFLRSELQSVNQTGQIPGTGLQENGDTNDDDYDSLPDLVSASDSDSSTEGDCLYCKEMPELVDYISEESDSDEYDESDNDENFPGSEKPVPKKRRKNTKLIAKIIEDQQARKEEEARREEEAKILAQKEVERLKEKSKITKLEKHKETLAVADNNSVSLSGRIEKINDILREASNSLIHNSFEQASMRYCKALAIIDEGSRNSLGFHNKSYVVVLYAYGTSLLDIGVPREIETARSSFKNILQIVVDFPLAHYGLGRVYYRENRFQEAIKSLEEGLRISSKVIFEPVYWPGTDVMIEESKGKCMKAAFDKIINLCKFPPNPDATCRSDPCTRTKRSIYHNDPDYKGYVRFFCNDACVVDYHVQCWKKYKSSNGNKSTEKDFLGNACFTLDCCGHIIKIQINDINGLKDELQSHKPKQEKETKNEKNGTAVPSILSKKKKRTKKKEQQKSDCKTDALKPAASVPCEKPAEPVKEVLEKVNDSEVTIPNLSDSGVLLRKKEDDGADFQVVKQSKGKAKKKKKNIQSLDEFLGPDSERYRARPQVYDDEEYVEIPSEPFSSARPIGWMNNNRFHIPDHLQNKMSEIENTSEDPWEMDSIREYVSSSFLQLLKIRGPLHVDNDIMRDNLKMLPDEAQKVVKDDGGLLPFLIGSRMFTIEHGVVTSLEEKFFTDLHKTVDKPRRNGKESIGVYDESKVGVNEIAGSVATERSVSDGYHSKTLVRDSLSKIGFHKTVETCNRDAGLIDSIPVNGLTNYTCQTNNDFLSQQSPLTSNNSSQSSPDCATLPSDCAAIQSKMHGKIPSNNEATNQLGKYFKHAYKYEPVTSPIEFKQPFYNSRTKQFDLDTEQQSTNKDTSVNNLPRVASPLLGDEGWLDRERSVVDTRNDHTSTGKICSGDNSVNIACTHIQNNEKQEPLDPKDSRDLIEYVKNLDLEKVDEILKDPRYSSPTNLCGKHGPFDTQNQDETSSFSTLTPKAQKANEDDISNNSLVSKTSETDTPEKIDVKTTSNITNSAQSKLSMGVSSIVDVKTNTKDKGILAKITMKNKTVMTEPLVNTYKMEYEKLLSTSGMMDLKHQEAAEKMEKLRKSQCQQIANLSQKLQKLEKQCLSQEKKMATVEARCQQEVDNLKKEKDEKEKQIEELRQKLIEQTDTDELRIQALEHELSLLEKRDRTQLETDKKQLDKLTTFSQQQTQRACAAEVKLLEVQRDVSINFYKRTIQEAEITLHHINQIITVNPSQFQGMSQKWQQYIDSCKQQMTVNGTQIAKSIARVKEGQPLVSLNLHIHRPGPYPGPPVLTMPPGVPPSSNTQISNAEASMPDPAVVKQGSVVQNPCPAPPQPVAATKPEKQTANKNASEQTEKAPNSFEKIMQRLLTLFPNHSRIQITNLIKEVRACKNGSLTGLSFDDIVQCVTDLVEIGESRASLTTSSNMANDITKEASRDVTSFISSGKNIHDEDPCVICHDDMTHYTNNVVLECQHKFHHGCIKKWLVGEQSTCPTCRVHTLLPDEFPKLR